MLWRRGYQVWGEGASSAGSWGGGGADEALLQVWAAVVLKSGTKKSERELISAVREKISAVRSSSRALPAR